MRRYEKCVHNRRDADRVYCTSRVIRFFAVPRIPGAFAFVKKRTTVVRMIFSHITQVTDFLPASIWSQYLHVQEWISKQLRPLNLWNWHKTQQRLQWFLTTWQYLTTNWAAVLRNKGMTWSEKVDSLMTGTRSDAGLFRWKQLENLEAITDKSTSSFTTQRVLRGPSLGILRTDYTPSSRSNSNYLSRKFCCSFQIRHLITPVAHEQEYMHLTDNSLYRVQKCETWR